jgi:hypothetical protein
LRKIAAACVVGAAIVSVPAAAAPAHQSGCHRHHVCPSDHATYKWKGKLCVKPSADERTGAFKHKVRYAGLTYYCK